MKKTQIKICGITSASDAAMAVKAGADAIGMIFVPGTPRFLSIKTAQEIRKVVPETVLLVGVFQNAPIETLLETIEATQLDAVQLHGSEDYTVARQIPVSVIKTVLVETAGPAEHFPGYETLPNLAAWLLDIPKTFKTSNPEHSVESARNIGDLLPTEGSLSAASETPVWMAGGLTPANVADFIRRFQPDGVDVSSGVEASPGVKDPAKVTDFIQAVRQADLESISKITSTGATP